MRVLLSIDLRVCDVLYRDCGNRQHDAEDRTGGGTGVHRDVTSVHFDRPLGDGQSKTSAASVSRSAFIEAKEAIEDPLAVFGGDPRSFVGNGENRLAAIRVHANANRR